MPLNLDADKIDLSNRGHIHTLIEEIETSQNVRRKKDAYIAYECQEGRQKDHVIERLKKLYPDSYSNFRVGNVEAVKKIIKKKSKAYKTSPIRKLEREEETIALEEIYDTFKFSRAFKQADKIFNLHKYVALWLTYKNPAENSEELKGTYKLHALAPYEYDLVLDHGGEPSIFCVNYADTEITRGADGIETAIADDQRDRSAETKKYKFYSKDYVVIVITKGKTGAKPSIESMEVKPNPIKSLPVAFLSTETNRDYPIGSSLADKVIDWNLEFSDLKTAASTQGHGQLVLSHDEGIKLKKLHMGMHTAINLPQPRKETAKATTAEYISASPDLLGQLGVLKFSLTQILDDEGIVAKSSIEGGVDNVKSGFDRILKEADVQDAVEDNQELYADCLEAELYKLVKAYEDALNTSLFKTEEISVTFEKPRVLISDKETLENIGQREELGLLLAHEKHMIINPNLSEEQAREREEEIAAEKEEKAKKMQSLLGTEEGEEDDNEDDELPPNDNEDE